MTTGCLRAIHLIVSSIQLNLSKNDSEASFDEEISASETTSHYLNINKASFRTKFLATMTTVWRVALLALKLQPNVC